MFVNLNFKRCKRYCCFSTGTIAPIVKAPNVSDHKSGGGEGLKMMVTISCVFVGIVVIFTGLLMLRRRRREQRLKRLRGERRGEGRPGCRQSLRFSQSNAFSLFVFQMPKVWLRCSWGKDVHTSVLVVVKKTWNIDFMKLLLCWPVKTHVQQSQSTSSSKHCVCILTSREPSCWSKRETPWRLLVGSATLSLFQVNHQTFQAQPALLLSLRWSIHCLTDWQWLWRHSEAEVLHSDPHSPLPVLVPGYRSSGRRIWCQTRNQ